MKWIQTHTVTVILVIEPHPTSTPLKTILPIIFPVDLLHEKLVIIPVNTVPNGV